MANITGEARTAEFCYVSPEGKQYVIVAVEDACDDQDYDDLVFAMNPSDAFVPRPQVTAGTTKSRGVYAFEDRWPNRADYDMNDVVLDVRQEYEFSTGKIKKQIYKITTYQNFVADKSGLAVKFNISTKPSSIVMKKIEAGSTEEVNVTFNHDAEAYYLTDDVTSELGSTYIFELTYSTPQQLSSIIKIIPFIYRNNSDGTRWEVHIPNDLPTSMMTYGFFNTFNDASDPENGKWYLCNDNYPFAFYLENGNIEYFIDTILKRENESKNIDIFFPNFINWSTSHGRQCADWYLFPKL